MPLWDYKCPWCGKVDVDVLEAIPSVHPHWCKDCKATMDRLPASPAFSINGFSAKNGYSKGRD